ncbi:MAG: hypothetical protein ACLP7F_07070 [Acidimicrobiales bacterium]
MAVSAIMSVPAPAGALGAAQTTQVLFPWSASGRLDPQVHVAEQVSGYCWTSSLEADDRYAWRCMAHNDIYDPCFAPPAGHVTKVLCNDMSPWDTAAVLMNLSEPVPLGQALTAPDWPGFAVQLANKGLCVLRELDHSPPVSGGPSMYLCASDHFANVYTGSQPWVAYYWGTSAFGGPPSDDTTHAVNVTVAYDGPD